MQKTKTASPFEPVYCNRNWKLIPIPSRDKRFYEMFNKSHKSFEAKLEVNKNQLADLQRTSEMIDLLAYTNVMSLSLHDTEFLFQLVVEPPI